MITDEKSDYLTHVYMANTDGTTSRQITFGDKSCADPQWSPNGKWLAFTSARSGKNDIWLMRLDGGEAEQLTNARISVLSFKWSPDSRQVAFVMPDAPDADRLMQQQIVNVVDEGYQMNRLWIISIERVSGGQREARLLTKGSYSINPGFDWAPDSKSIVFTHPLTPDSQDDLLTDVSTVEVATGEVKLLTHASYAASSNAPMYSPDGRWIVYVSNEKQPQWLDKTFVYLVEATGGLSRKLVETIDPYLIGWSGDGQRIYISEFNKTRTYLSTLSIKDGSRQDLNQDAPVIWDVCLNASRTMIGFTAQHLTRPPEGFVARIDRFVPVQVS